MNPMSSNHQDQTHLIPVELLPSQWQCSSESLESFLAHLMIRVPQRLLVCAFLVLNQSEYLLRRRASGGRGNRDWERYRRVVLRFKLHLHDNRMT